MFRRSGRRFADKYMRQTKESRAYFDSIGTKYALRKTPPQSGDQSMAVSPFDIARVLSEALPHMQQYDEEIVVVKYGGHAMGEEALARDFARDIVLLEQAAINPVVVHGG